MKRSKARPRLRLTPHAEAMMRARNVTRTEVGLVVDEPDASYPQPEQRRVFQRRNLAVVVQDDWTVVTVLLRTYGSDSARWDNIDVRTRQLLPTIEKPPRDTTRGRRAS